MKQRVWVHFGVKALMGMSRQLISTLVAIIERSSIGSTVLIKGIKEPFKPVTICLGYYNGIFSLTGIQDVNFFELLSPLRLNQSTMKKLWSIRGSSV